MLKVTLSLTEGHSEEPLTLSLTLSLTLTPTLTLSLTEGHSEEPRRTGGVAESPLKSTGAGDLAQGKQIPHKSSIEKPVKVHASSDG